MSRLFLCLGALALYIAAGAKLSNDVARGHQLLRAAAAGEPKKEEKKEAGKEAPKEG